MEDIGLRTDEICDIFKIVASVLKLGNLQFVPTTNMDGTEGCGIANEYGKVIFHVIFLNHLKFGQKILIIMVRIMMKRHESNAMMMRNSLLISLLTFKLHNLFSCLN